MGDGSGHERSSQVGGRGIALGFGEMPLEDRLGSALAELGLENCREGKAPTGPERADPIRAALSPALSHVSLRGPRLSSAKPLARGLQG